MSKIHVLSEHLSTRIAAGEVIERPASVLKELVENAIDAGADRIRVEIERAGTRLIAVSDNGCGMDPDDALLSLEPHGTSKIREEADIDRIATLGFRGEAIPSIAAISRFSIETRTADALEGFRVEVAGGKIVETLPAGCAPGTTIRVRDLFFNTPARKIRHRCCRQRVGAKGTGHSRLVEVETLTHCADMPVRMAFVKRIAHRLDFFN